MRAFCLSQRDEGRRHEKFLYPDSPETEEAVRIREMLWELVCLLLKLTLISGILIGLFTFVFGIFTSGDLSMSPSVKAGDLVIYYRLQKEYHVADVVVIEKAGEKQVRRVAAVEGDTVNITEEGLVINGYVQQEQEIYEPTELFAEGIKFPLTVGKGEVFILGDSRTKSKDSRIYGTVGIEEIKGIAITTIRRRGI